MDASKLTNGSGTEPVAKSGPPNSVRSEAKKVSKRAVGEKATTERPRPKAIGSSKSEKLISRYCGSDDLAPSFIKRRDGRCRECFSKRYGSGARPRTKKDEGQEVGFAQIDKRARARERSWAP
jgi:hypothetical protein